jgi:hydroxymethylpyrimidine/phosphomethylpyrimidine kinase
VPTPVALTIAGSDPSGGAGLQADLKTFHRFGVYGEAVVTLLTVQNTRRVSKVEILPPALVVEQLQAVLEDIPPAAIKTGALGDTAIIEALAGVDFHAPLIVDPVMISKHGSPLMAAEARWILLQRLLPKAALITPNLHETEALTGLKVETLQQMRDAARALADATGAAVLVKGGHLTGDAIDVLCAAGSLHEYPGQRFDTVHTHGTGCTYSAAITACLARGMALPAAVAEAKAFITRAIATAPGLGGGQGPVNHFA